MDYRKTYDRLIQKRRSNPLSKDDCYCETHHIIPKSEGGLDEPDNLVNLTAREHYIAHLLLWKIYKDYKCAQAVLLFRYGSKYNQRKYRKTNSRLYQKAKEFAAKLRSEIYSSHNHPRFGKHHSDETRQKMSLAQKGKQRPWQRGKPVSEEVKRKISITCRGHKPTHIGHHSEEAKRKMSESHKGQNNPLFGKHHSEEAKRKMSESKNGEKNHWFGKHWYNDGTINVRASECPDGFVKGRLPAKRCKYDLDNFSR